MSQTPTTRMHPPSPPPLTRTNPTPTEPGLTHPTAPGVSSIPPSIQEQALHNHKWLYLARFVSLFEAGLLIVARWTICNLVRLHILAMLHFSLCRKCCYLHGSAVHTTRDCGFTYCSKAGLLKVFLCRPKDIAGLGQDVTWITR